MLIESVVADAFGTKCYVLATGKGAECVVVDPGIRVTPGLEDLLAEHRLRPAAVMITHGHLDHTCSVAPVCGSRDIPAFIHPGDRPFLADPLSGLGDFLPQFRKELGDDWEWTAPDDVRLLEDGTDLELAGVPMRIEHAPGHTPGSILISLPGDDEADAYCLVGDVIYAGTIGTTGMPGGSREQTLRSLKTKILTKPDDTVLLTAHGRDTTVGAEREVNPFVRQALEWQNGDGR
ncbi:MBL fold metallo-hydrolase [Glycomyces halotolerans]